MPLPSSPDTDAHRHFHDELHELELHALGGIDLVLDLLDRSLAALEREDVGLAMSVVAEDEHLNRLYLDVHERIVSLLACQSPMAGDLRVVAALLHTSAYLERMGNQCVSIAELVGPPGHEPAALRDIRTLLHRMGVIARLEVAQAGRAFVERDLDLAEDLARQDREVDEIERELLRRLIEVDHDDASREWAMHMALVARALERIGDNAVDVGEQTAFVVSGLFREFAGA